MFTICKHLGRTEFYYEYGDETTEVQDPIEYTKKVTIGEDTIKREIQRVKQAVTITNNILN